MTVFLLTLLFAIPLLLLWSFYAARRSTADELFTMFGLDPDQYEVLGYDLGRRPRKVFLRADGLVGVPDALFRHRGDRHLVIGEFKSRRYRGQLRDYECYQMTLYQGVAQRRYRQPARGLFRFGCGRVVEHAFDPATYSRLLPLANELRALDACSSRRLMPRYWRSTTAR